MNVPKVETANSVTRIANIDALGGRQIFWDGTVAHVALDRPRGLKTIGYSGPSGAQAPSWAETILRCGPSSARIRKLHRTVVEREEELKTS